MLGHRSILQLRLCDFKRRRHLLAASCRHLLIAVVSRAKVCIVDKVPDAQHEGLE